MDNRTLFTHKAEDYSAYRPSYPAAALEWLKLKTQAERVVDIGAGTGIFTACLKPYFSGISAIEPNEDMREKFHKFLPDIPCLDSCGEATLLDEKSVELITVAQAFHWLDEDKFKTEAQRILSPGGKVAIIWNTSVKDDFTMARDLICREYCPRFRKGHAGKRTPAEGDEFLRCRYFKSVEVAEFSNPFVMDRNTFAGNIRSRSYALTPQDKDYPEFMQKLHAVFDRFSCNGTVTELQNTQIYLGMF